MVISPRKECFWNKPNNVTFLLCANAGSSNKMRLENLTILRHSKTFSWNLYYEVFGWLQKTLKLGAWHEMFNNSKEKNLPRNALLLVNNTISHGFEEELINSYRLQTNCTALLQPMKRMFNLLGCCSREGFFRLNVLSFFRIRSTRLVFQIRYHKTKNIFCMGANQLDSLSY